MTLSTSGFIAGVTNSNVGLAASLANNGGPAETIALLASSPALDAGTLAGTFLTSFTDEVGTPRTLAPDLGAWQHPASPSSYTITVNDTSDVLDNPTTVTYSSLGSNVTLRDAINAADNTGGDATIVLASGRRTTSPRSTTTGTGPTPCRRSRRTLRFLATAARSIVRLPVRLRPTACGSSTSRGEFPVNSPRAP